MLASDALHVPDYIHRDFPLPYSTVYKPFFFIWNISRCVGGVTPPLFGIFQFLPLKRGGGDVKSNPFSDKQRTSAAQFPPLLRPGRELVGCHTTMRGERCFREEGWGVGPLTATVHTADWQWSLRLRVFVILWMIAKSCTTKRMVDKPSINWCGICSIHCI